MRTYIQQELHREAHPLAHSALLARAILQAADRSDSGGCAVAVNLRCGPQELPTLENLLRTAAHDLPVRLVFEADAPGGAGG